MEGPSSVSLRRQRCLPRGLGTLQHKLSRAGGSTPGFVALEAAFIFTVTGTHLLQLWCGGTLGSCYTRIGKAFGTHDHLVHLSQCQSRACYAIALDYVKKKKSKGSLCAELKRQGSSLQKGSFQVPSYPHPHSGLYPASTGVL